MARAVCLIVPLFLYSQSQITFRQLSVHQGLSQNSAISVTQDSTGYLWIATQDGLNRYDGREFTVYPFTFEDITKPNYSQLGKVYRDRQGGLWIIPSDRILRKFDYAGQVFEAVEGVVDASVVFQDSSMDIWAGTFSRGLFKRDPKTGTFGHVASFDGGDTPIYSISQSDDEHILLTTKGRLIVYDTQKNIFEELSPNTKYGERVQTNFSAVEVDSSGRQWIGSFGDGLFYKEGDDPTLYRISERSFTDPLPINLNIEDLYLDSKDRLWVATYGRGLFMIDFNSSTIDHFIAEKHNPKALHYDDILCIYEDDSGIVWFGTDGAGLSYYDEYLEKFNFFTNYQTPDNISIDVVRSIAVDSNATVWVGTSGKGLTQYEPTSNSWRTYTVDLADENALRSNRIMSLFVDRDNELWIGTQGGGLTIREGPGKFRSYHKASLPSLSANTIWCIYRDERQRIWLGTREEGLIRFDKKKGEITKYNYDPRDVDGISSNNIRVITSDGKGNLWIGTEADGILFFDTGKETFKAFKATGREDGPSSDHIKSLYYDGAGILWVGTNGGGLNSFDIDKNLFAYYTVEEGLANNVIYSILPDKRGNLWLSSNKGITKFGLHGAETAELDITNYTNYDGLATEFNTGAHYTATDGTLYFGGLEGFYWFDPENLDKNTTLPKTTITGFEVLGKSFPLTGPQVLPYDRNTVVFTFSGLQYSLPEKSEYRYRLLNYDDGWVAAGNQNFARYTRLPPGAYEFQVKASNYDGVWNDTPASFAFTVKPPWYLTTLAKFAYLLALVLIVIALYKYLKWRWKIKMRLQLKEEETLRLKELNKLKSKLYTDISHEFRTPLTLIAGPIDTKLGEEGLSDQDFSNFSMIKRNTNRMISLVDQLLHLAKLEKGGFSLNLSKGNIELFLKMLAASFEYQAQRKQMDYNVDVGNIGEAFYDEDALDKIVSNLLSNAFKHGLEGGACSFSASREEDCLKICVKNEIDPVSDIDVQKLFTRFYQKNKYAEGAGIGLSLVRETVKLYKGKLNAVQEGDGSLSFEVSLPVFKTASISDMPSRRSIDEPETDDVGYRQTKAAAEANDKKAKNRPILLIVEDHAEIRAFLKSIWNETYEVYEAVNGKEGIDKALKTVPDLIVTDIRMPKIDGIELCKRLKADERTSHIPIIVLTAGTGEDYEMRGLQSGADDFVAKPFKIRVLTKRVDNLIEGRRALRTKYSQELKLQASDMAITSTDELFLNKVQQLLDEKLNDPQFNAKVFSTHLGMSRMQLHRKLQTYTGLSTTEFIRSQRLKLAAHILKTSDITINEVAYAVGFNTPSYFIKCFKETYKKTPAEYLKADS